MVKGNQTGQSSKATTKYVGFTKVQVAAVNPTRSQLNKLLGKEDSPEDKEIVYLSEDQNGNERVRLSFWLYDDNLKNYFVHSFNLTNRERLSKDGLKSQYVNCTCTTAWTDEESNLPTWFTSFQKDGHSIGDKQYRKALLGEEELAIFLRSWLGRMVWTNLNCSVLIDTKALFSGDYSELQNLIDGEYDTPFVILTGVRTDENDSEKQYQQVYGKSFLPKSFMEYIEGLEKRGDKVFPNEYAKKAWNRFETGVNDKDFGFDAYFELAPIKEYDRDKDITASLSTKVVTPVNSNY